MILAILSALFYLLVGWAVRVEPWFERPVDPKHYGADK